MKIATALLLVALFVTIPSAAPAQILDDSRRQLALQRYRNGQELMFAEQFEKAAEQFRHAIDLDPLLTLAHYGLGQSYMALKRYASAIDAYLGCRDAYRNLYALRQSRTFDRDRRAEDEIRELKNAITALRSGRIKVRGGLTTTVDTRIALLENRIRDLERIRGMDAGAFRTPAEVSLGLGSAYFRNGDLADAEREWKAAVDVNPRLGEAHNNLAVIYMITRRKKEAENAVQAAERAGFRVNSQLKEDIKAITNH
jgi:tetratricopeptide (TPR) repeat protein